MAEELNSGGANAEQEKSSGPLIGVIVIVLVLALGGLYLWSMRLGEAPTTEDILRAPDTTLEALMKQGSSDEVQDIEADLQGTELNSLDQDLEDIGAEVDTL